MASKPDSKPNWGLLPQDIITLLHSRYWQNRRNLKELLKGNRPFPIVLPLKPPSGNQAIQNLSHLQSFVSAWKEFSVGLRRRDKCGSHVRWTNKNFRTLENQDLATHLEIADINSLIELLGQDAKEQLKNWHSKIKYILDALSLNDGTGEEVGDGLDVSFGDGFIAESDNVLDVDSGDGIDERVGEGVDVNTHSNLFHTLIDHLETIEKFEQNDLELLVKLIPQLKKNMGQGCYLRALPIIYVDTKFIENNLRLIESISTATIDSNIKEKGLIKWLNCIEKPKTWLLVKPLCTKTKQLMGNLPLLRISSDTLENFELPADNILVIENEQSCLALQNITNTIAVAGGGKNVAWMNANWLATKNVAYWGDIDSEGLNILSDARSKLSSITPIMMDEITVEKFQERMVAEPDSVTTPPIALTEKELILFEKLRASYYLNKRLEQERLPIEYVNENIEKWLNLNAKNCY